MGSIGMPSSFRSVPSTKHLRGSSAMARLANLLDPIKVGRQAWPGMA